jgi:dTDP-glucose 4,6-dehydratase
VDTNVTGTHRLLMAARRAWIEEGRAQAHRFHQVSTDEVYGSLQPDEPPFRESTPYAPNSPYAASKAGADFLVRAYHRTYGLCTTISNCSNNYGPYQFPEKLIPLFLINCLQGLPLPIYGDGLNVRDWLHVHDHCRAIDLVLARGRPGETYNVGGASEVPNLALIDRVCSLLDAEFRRDPGLQARFPDCPAARGRPVATLKVFVQDRAGHDRRYGIDMAKIRDDLGFRLTVDLATGLARTVRWYLENESWWRGILARPVREPATPG